MTKGANIKRIVIICIVIAVLVGLAIFLVTKKELPEDMLNRYFSLLEEKDYKECYKLLDAESKNAISEKDFTEKHQNIYGSIQGKDLSVKITKSTDQNKTPEETTVSYSVKMNTSAGEIKYSNYAIFVHVDNENGPYSIKWSPRMIFPDLDWGDRVSIRTLQGERGKILDRNGKVLAGEGKASSIGLVPGKMKSKKDTAKVAALLDMKTSEVNKKLAAKWVKEDSFVPLRILARNNRKVKSALIQIPGIMITDEPVRYYPLGKKASHLVGYIQKINGEELEMLQEKGYGSNSVLGKAGLEALCEDQLRADNGREIVIVNADGRTKETLAKTNKRDGKDLNLTIDAAMQSKLYDQFSADKSCSVAMNPKTGEVLALVSTPTYDANDFVMGMSAKQWDSLNKDKDKPMYNRFKAALCPGSTMKAVTAAIALDSGTLKPGDDLGHSGLSWQKNKSWGGYHITTLKEYGGAANIQNALVHSDNIFFGKAALKIGEKTFSSGLKKAGFEEKIPFELGLYSSIITNNGFNSDIQLADSGYGQGEIRTNPIHLASLYTSFLNNGTMLKPQLLSSEKEIWMKNLFTAKTASIIRQDLVEVVERGTGKEAKIPGMTLAGKTGTAEIKVSKEDKKGTELGWYVMMTADSKAKDQLIVLSMVEDVKKRGGSHYVIPGVRACFK